jgi:hypothetical protein
MFYLSARNSEKKRRKELQMTWLGAPDYPVVHRTVSGARRLDSGEKAALGKNRRHTAIIHRTVR